MSWESDTPMPVQHEGFLARGLRVSWPHLVLLAVYFVYLGIGGCVFLAIEGGSQPDYTLEVGRYEALKAQIDGAVRNVTEGRDVSVRNLTALWEEYVALVNDSYLDDLTYLSRVAWTFTGSVLFCATSIATIGYGDAVPVTSLGRVVIVIYSLVGIPLTLTFLADIGRLLARVVMLISVRCACIRRKTGKSPRSRDPEPTGTEPLHHLNGLSSRSGGSAFSEDLSEMRITLGVFQDSSESVHGSRPNSRRNSLDAEAPKPDSTQQHPAIIAQYHLGHVSGTNLAFTPDDKTGREEEKKSPNGPMGSGEATLDQTAVAREDTPADRTQGNVSVFIVVIILLAYTLLGALMIAYVEGWYYGEALYFTFVTLTTIGFGDFVPVKHYMDIPSFFGCLVYTIVGLSVMSMCIALVQAKVVKLVSNVAGKVGF